MGPYDLLQAELRGDAGRPLVTYHDHATGRARRVRRQHRRGSVPGTHRSRDMPRSDRSAAPAISTPCGRLWRPITARPRTPADRSTDHSSTSIRLTRSEWARSIASPCCWTMRRTAGPIGHPEWPDSEGLRYRGVDCARIKMDRAAGVDGHVVCFQGDRADLGVYDRLRTFSRRRCRSATPRAVREHVQLPYSGFRMRNAKCPQ